MNKNTGMDLSAPVLFLARGHSGTSPLARALEEAGVYMGDSRDPKCLNETYDSLPFTYDFQRTLVPRLFANGQGCRVDAHEVVSSGTACLARHLAAYQGGPWGFKTCAAMFAHPLYRHLFPRARYIHLVRDGRDVVLSGEGYFHLTNPNSREQDWDYFKILTFGLTDDEKACPFALPKRPKPNDAAMKNRYWLQAKSWCEHVRMMEHLKKTDQLAPNFHTIRYEDLCQSPAMVLDQLFDFLELPLPESVKAKASDFFHTGSIGRYQRCDELVDSGEDMHAIYHRMAPELERMGYQSNESLDVENSLLSTSS